MREKEKFMGDIADSEKGGGSANSWQNADCLKAIAVRFGHKKAANGM
jgi:hypothetical protein